MGITSSSEIIPITDANDTVIVSTAKVVEDTTFKYIIINNSTTVGYIDDIDKAIEHINKLANEDIVSTYIDMYQIRKEVDRTEDQYILNVYACSPNSIWKYNQVIGRYKVQKIYEITN